MVPVPAFSRRQPRQSGAAFLRLVYSDLVQFRAGGRNTWRKKVGVFTCFDNSVIVGWFKLLVELCSNPGTAPERLILGRFSGGAAQSHALSLCHCQGKFVEEIKVRCVKVLIFFFF